MKVGERVGAILGSKDGRVQFLGYGVYAGREVPPATGERSMTSIMHEIGMGNPKIVLDNGDVVWGCECWWGSEAEVMKQIGAAHVVDVVRIADFRGAPPNESNPPTGGNAP